MKRFIKMMAAATHMTATTVVMEVAMGAGIRTWIAVTAFLFLIMSQFVSGNCA